MKRPSPPDWARGHLRPVPDQVAGARRLSLVAPVKALFYGGALVGLVVALAVLEGVVALADAVEAYRRG